MHHLGSSEFKKQTTKAWIHRQTDNLTDHVKIYKFVKTKFGFGKLKMRGYCLGGDLSLLFGILSLFDDIYTFWLLMEPLINKSIS
jgi:hypothetical protein